MPQNIELNWVGPFSYFDIVAACRSKDNKHLLSDYDKPGVYLHATEVCGLACVDYIGKSKSSVLRRQIEHFTNWIGGRYTIPFYCRECKKTIIPDLKNGEYADLVLDKTKFINHVSECFDSAANIDVYFAVIVEQNGEKLKNAVNAMERKLLYDLQPFTTDRGTYTEVCPEYSYLFSGVLKDMKTVFRKNNLAIYNKYGREEPLFMKRKVDHL